MQKSGRPLVLLLAALLWPLFDASAEYAANVNVAYETTSGWSDYRKATLTFYSGVELQAKGWKGVDRRYGYALIQFGEGRVAVLQTPYMVNPPREVNFKPVPLGDGLSPQDRYRHLKKLMEEQNNVNAQFLDWDFTAASFKELFKSGEVIKCSQVNGSTDRVWLIRGR